MSLGMGWTPSLREKESPPAGTSPTTAERINPQAMRFLPDLAPSSSCVLPSLELKHRFLQTPAPQRPTSQSSNGGGQRSHLRRACPHLPAARAAAQHEQQALPTCAASLKEFNVSSSFSLLGSTNNSPPALPGVTPLPVVLAGSQQRGRKELKASQPGLPLNPQSQGWLHANPNSFHAASGANLHREAAPADGERIRR